VTPSINNIQAALTAQFKSAFQIRTTMYIPLGKVDLYLDVSRTKMVVNLEKKNNKDYRKRKQLM
jgi:hypothetical protein